MKILGRIVIILAAFAIVMGLTYVAVNAVSGSTSSLARTEPGFDRGPESTPHLEGERHDFGGVARPLRLIAGLIKNVGIVAVIVAMITIPKSLMKRKVIPATLDRE